MSVPPGGEPEPSPGSHYTLRLAGHLDQHWSAWFDGLTLTQHHDGTTTLDGVVADQAALHGLLAKVRDLGVPLLSVRAGAAASVAETESAADTDGPLQPEHSSTRIPETATFVDQTTAMRQRREEVPVQTLTDPTSARAIPDQPAPPTERKQDVDPHQLPARRRPPR